MLIYHSIIKQDLLVADKWTISCRAVCQTIRAEMGDEKQMREGRWTTNVWNMNMNNNDSNL